MFEKVNPSHPDKVADRIAGAIVDLCYTKSRNRWSNESSAKLVMANEKKNVHRYFEVYEAMKKAVPDDNNMLEVMRACEFIIADCIAQSNVGKEVEEQTYKAIADDIRKFTEAFKPIAEEAEKED